MTDYTKSQNWTEKKTNESDILAADHDTELDLISTAINSKSNKVSSPTTGNLAEMNANGELVDSGIASANLDGLTSNIQTQLDAKVGPLVSAPTNHIRAGNFHFHDGTTGLTALQAHSVITEDTWESVGPTGSGADNIWADMDDMPSTATGVMVYIHYDWTASSTATSSFTCHYTIGDDESPSTGVSNRPVWHVADSDASGEIFTSTVFMIIPVSGDQIFKFRWLLNPGTITTLELFYKGFVNE
jgi:hypothetical protein